MPEDGNEVIVVAFVEPKAADLDEVREVMRGVIARVHDEDEGCLLYALHDSGNRLVMIEKWRDAAALAAHGSSAASAEFGKALQGRLERAPEVLRLSAVHAGTVTQGQL